METNNSQLVIYNAPDGTMSIDVTVQNETVWLSQGQMAELFGKDQSVIARHISNVFKEGELDKESNMQILHNTLSKFKPTQVYSLDVIISVGYRVKSGAVHCSEMKRMTLSKAPSDKYIRHSMALTSILQSRRRQPCSCISLPRTTLSATATNALPPHCSCGFSMATAYFIMRTAPSVSPITPLSPSPS